MTVPTSSSASTATSDQPSSSARLGLNPSQPGPKFELPQVKGHREVHDHESRLKTVSRDFRSDTLTVPTERMFKAMADASRGDDVYEEDETTAKFQESIAMLAGKEAAMYVVSGTMSNQLALRTHLLQPPHSVLMDDRCHVHRYEAGALATLSGATSLTIRPSNGRYLRWDEDIAPNLVLEDNIHYAPTKVISLENTLNGTLFPQEEIVKISKHARELGVIMHLDGARIWNVSAETGLSIAELCEPFDSVSLCLSKGLGAPIGSILVGSSKFIGKGKHFRKMYGGGIRQCGPIVAAARVAIEDHFPKLKATHEMAAWLQSELTSLGADMLFPAETSMLWVETSPLGFSCDEFNARLAAQDPPIKGGAPRFVIHHQIDPEAVERIVQVAKEMKDEVASTGTLREREHGVQKGTRRVYK
ncbi:unnamed protein product [Sympodiomycopsis kandeliae]